MTNKKRGGAALYGGIAGGLIVLVVGLFFVFEKPPTEIPEPETADAPEPTPQIAVPVAKQKSVQDEFPLRRTHQAWFATTNPEIPASTPEQELPKDSVYVRVSDSYRQWLLGTPVEIYIPQTDVTYTGIVDRITPDGFGNFTVYAGPEPDDSVFKKLILTYNQKNTLAYVSTLEGNFELTASGEYGLLVPSSSLPIAKDPSIPDVGEREDRYKDAEYVPRRPK